MRLTDDATFADAIILKRINNLKDSNLETKRDKLAEDERD